MDEKYIIPIKIIIAEDDELYMLTLQDYFKDKPAFELVGSAEDGKTAVSMTREHRPDAVIMDLGLPVLSGMEAIKRIRDFNSNVKIIVLTAHTDENEAIESIAAGATAYINKNIDIKHLNTIIETVNDGAVWLSPLIGYKVLSEGIKRLGK